MLSLTIYGTMERFTVVVVMKTILVLDVKLFLIIEAIAS